MKDDGSDTDYCEGIKDIEDSLKQMRLVATKHKSETCITPMSNSIAYEELSGENDVKEISENWVHIEEDEFVQNFEIDQELEIFYQTQAWKLMIMKVTMIQMLVYKHKLSGSKR